MSSFLGRLLSAEGTARPHKHVAHAAAQGSRHAAPGGRSARCQLLLLRCCARTRASRRPASQNLVVLPTARKNNEPSVRSGTKGSASAVPPCLASPASSIWWSCGDSNPVPQHCQCCALPDELQPHDDMREAGPLGGLITEAIRRTLLRLHSRPRLPGEFDRIATLHRRRLAAFGLLLPIDAMLLPRLPANRLIIPVTLTTVNLRRSWNPIGTWYSPRAGKDPRYG